MNEDYYFWWDDGKGDMEERLRMAVKAVSVYLFVFVAMMVLCALTGCRGTEIVTVEKVRIDTLREYHTTYDSIHVHDSISVVVKGDTVIKDRWHTEWRDRWQHDTVYVARTDSVPKPYPVVKEVERQMSSWECFVMWAGRITLIALALAVGYGVYRLWKRIRNKI